MAEKVKMLIPEEEVNARIEELGKKISEEDVYKRQVYTYHRSPDHGSR